MVSAGVFGAEHRPPSTARLAVYNLCTLSA